MALARVLVSPLVVLCVVMAGCEKQPDTTQPADSPEQILNRERAVAQPSIGDFVWHDINCNGCQDFWEPGIEGVELTLNDTLGNFIASTTTASDGSYLFESLQSNVFYQVVVTTPASFTPSPSQVPACNDDEDSNPSPWVTMPTDLTVDFGFCDGGEGCSPGYWKQSHHFGSWENYTPDTLFSDVFEDAFPGMTLLQVAGQGGGGLKALGRHTVAALLNSSSTEVDYDLTESEVIEMFNDVYPGSKPQYNDLKNMFESFNEQGCTLSRNPLHNE